MSLVYFCNKRFTKIKLYRFIIVKCQSKIKNTVKNRHPDFGDLIKARKKWRHALGALTTILIWDISIILIIYFFLYNFLVLGTNALDFQVYQRDVATADQLPELEVRGSIFCKTARKLIHYALNRSNGTCLNISTQQTFI